MTSSAYPNLANANKQTPNNLLKNRIACGELNLNRSNLTELSQVKESDILNDEINESPLSDFKNNHLKNNILRSSTTSMSFANHVKQPPFGLHDNKTPRNYLSVKIRTPSDSSSLQQKTNTNVNNKNHNNSSLDDLLLSNKQMLKMNHIEDALASVLDDMKQLDFATTPSKSYSHANQTLSAIKSSNNTFLKSTTHSSNGYYESASNGTSNSLYIKPDSKKNLAKRIVNFNDEKDLSDSENSYEDLSSHFGKNLTPQAKRLEKSAESLLQGQELSGNSFSQSKGLALGPTMSLKNKTLDACSPHLKSLNGNDTNVSANLNKRPDLVLDLPVNLLVSSSPNNFSQQYTNINVRYLK